MWKKYLVLLLCIIQLTRCAVTSSSVESTESTSEIKSSSTEVAEPETTGNDTTIVPDEETTTKPPNEEAKLPVDLLSEDVLLDPNVVLARLSRRDLRGVDAKWSYQPYQYSWQDYQRPVRRIYPNYKQPPSPPKKFKVYPVFPGK